MIKGQNTTTNRLNARTIAFGALGGIGAGLVMLVPMMGLMTAIGLPANLFPTLLGIMIGQQSPAAPVAGIALHLLAGATIGALFGFVTGSLRTLRTDKFVKGIGLGIATGIIAFVLLFIPVLTTAMPQQMFQLMKMMNPGMNDQIIMAQLQKIQPMILGGSFVSHIIYGAVLGAVVTSLVKANKSNKPENECETCLLHFQTEEEFSNHKSRYKN